MDTFTQNILARARERQKMLHEYQNNKENEGIKNEDNKEESYNTKKLLSENSFNKIEENSLDQDNRPSFSRQNSKTLVESKSLGSPGSPRHNTLNIQKENFNMEIKVTSTDQIRFQVEIEEECSDKEFEEKSSPVENEKGLRKAAKDRLNRLGQLYAGGDDANISSPIHRTEENFLIDPDKEERTISKFEKIDKGKGLKGLANLAETINQWEDIAKPSSTEKGSIETKKSKKGPAPKPSTPTKKQEQLGSKKLENANEKKIKWDKSVLESLESQGFTKTKSDSRLIYEYPSSPEKKQDKNIIKTPFRKVEVNTKDNSPKKITTNAISDKTAFFENSNQTKGTKDPSLLSLSERKALFEKNKGEVLLPKAPFGMSIPINDTKKQNKPFLSKFAQSPFIKADESNNANKKLTPKKYPAPPITNDKKIEKSSPVKTVQKTISPVKSTVQQAGGIASTVAALMEKKNTISQDQIESRVKAEREKEMELLLNRFNKKKESYPTNAIVEESESEKEEECSEVDSMLKNNEEIIAAASPQRDNENQRLSNKRHSMSPKVAAVLEDVKRIKVSPAKPGRLYPNLSDIEAATETENEETAESTRSNSFDNSFESGDADTSFGREILEAVCKNNTPHKRANYPESDLSDVLDDMDDYLDEAMAYSQAMKELGPTPPKQTKSTGFGNEVQTSNSFNYKAFSKSSLEQQDFKSPLKVRSPRKSIESQNYIVEGNNVLPLTHTVSFYRKQQAMVPTSPTRQITHITPVDEDSSEENTDQIVLEKIRKLQLEVNKQQMIISQTSQALNICNTTLEFMGSTEQVEAEKVLLLSTHRRQAMMNEIQRLNIEGTLTPVNKHAQDVPLEKGSLTITNIVLPLKKEYVRALAAAGGKGHHVVCLVKCGEQVVPSKLVSTVATNVKNPEYDLKIPDSIVLKDIYSDFAITFEVYCLQAQEELLSHEVKYHINKKSSKSTPKKSKHDSRLVRPIKESPAGPQAVRSPSFALMGYMVFSIKQINKTHWTLNNTPSMSPLEGSVNMKLSCELTVSVEQRGFLTMFEDVSGFGAWHRRWCLLKGHTLCYWKYPDDEKKSAPIDSLDLRYCITKEVGPVSREICARLYTFLIETEREPRSTDKDTLVTICKKDKTIVRHLLSADTKEERVQWCAKFNAALTALRLWEIGRAHV